MEATLKQVFSRSSKGIGRFYKAFYKNALFVVTCVLVIVLLIAIRSRTFPDLMTRPFLYVYSVLIFSFTLGRIISSFFYKASLRKLIDTPAARIYEPVITFVVPCKNEEAAIEHTVETCLAADYPKEKIEVIVINDGSTDSTGEILRRLESAHPELIVIHWEKNKGKREGMAEGFRKAKGEIVIQIDSDSYIEPKTIREMITPFSDPTIAAVCGHADVANPNENYITKMQAAYYYVSFRVMKAAESVFYTVFCCSGCSSAYRKDVVLPILDAWLNERFLGTKVTYGDDRSLTTWMLKAGYHTVYTDRVQAYTIAPNNWNQLFKQQLRWKKSWIINGLFTSKFIVKHDIFTALFYFLPMFLFSIITPFVAFYNVYLHPFTSMQFPLFYFLGMLLITSILVLYYKLLRRNNNLWPYLLLWQFLTAVFFSYIIIYAAFKIKDRGWGTR